MAESNKLTGQHHNFNLGIFDCEKLLRLKRTKGTAPLLISQITQARADLESKKVKIDDLDLTLGQRYKKCTRNMDKALTDLETLLKKSPSQYDVTAFKSDHRGPCDHF